MSEPRSVATEDVRLDRTTPRRVSAVVVVVLALLLAGAALRAIRLDEPPLAFQPTRQYFDALLTRKYEVALGGDPSGLPHAVVRAAAPREIEPPIIDSITAASWRILGDEPLWLPRAVSIMAWVLGGWFLFLLMRRLATWVAGVAAVVVWSFLPFAVAATRVFQPDPLMVASLTAALFALVVFDDAPTRRGLVVAGLAGGFAVFVKSPAIFFVAPAFVALTYRRGGWRAIRSRATAAYAALVVAPALLWNVYGFWIDGFLQHQEENRLLPRLLTTDTFWRGWTSLGLKTFGVVVPLAAVVGVLLARGRARWFGAALFVGYVGFGLVFTYHYMTHDYYHLPFVLVCAVGVGLLADRARGFVKSRNGDILSIAAVTAVALIVLIGFRVSVRPIHFSFVPAAVSEDTRLAEIEVPQRIGRELHHARSLVFLAPSFGNTLMYYGGVAGSSWPETNDVETSLRNLREKRGATFFVVTDMRAWRAAPNLRAFLRRYPLIDASEHVRIYDIRSPRASGSSQ